jgi:carboxypeptidase T
MALAPSSPASPLAHRRPHALLLALGCCACVALAPRTSAQEPSSTRQLSGPSQVASELPTTRPPSRLVRVTIDGPEALLSLIDLDLDTLCGGPTRTEAGLFQDLIVDDAQLETLEARGLTTTVLIPDLVLHYQSRFLTPDDRAAMAPAALGTGLSPPFAQGSLGGFYTWSEVVSLLDQLSAAYPAITTDKLSIATTAEGRDVWMIKVSDNPDVDENEPEVRMDAMHHAREPQSMQSVIWFLSFLLEGYGTDPLATYLVNEREIWFIPVVNPDGYVFNQNTDPAGGGLWRKNRFDNGDGSFGTDLNRNYPYLWGFDDVGSSPDPSSITYRGASPGSEAETQGMLTLMDQRSFATAISAHSYGNIWLTPWGYDGDVTLTNQAAYDEINAAASPPGWPAGAGESLLGYTANGSTNDEDQGGHGTLSWTPEIGSSADGFWPATTRIVPLAEEALPGLQATALAAGAYVHQTALVATEEGNGDGFYEAEESLALRLSLRNSGLAATNTVVSLSLSTTSGDATVTTGLVSVGSLGSFSSADNNGNPLRLQIDAGVPSGTVIDYQLTVSAEGYDQLIPGSIITGKPRPFVFDDAEVDLGWTLGLVSDTATTGLWTRDDPIGTTDNGNQVQPDNDFTAGAGTQAYMTGNGSTTAGGDDVDNGLTTLVSPPFDLSGVDTAVLSYARWYALFSQIDDTLEVSISNDDGQSWTALESVGGGANSWQTPQFIVHEILPLGDKMRLRFIASDDPNNSLVEALVDDLRIDIYDDAPRMNLYGEQLLDGTVRFNLSGEAGSPFIWFFSTGTGFLQFSFIQGPFLLDATQLFTLFSAAIPPGGLLPVDILMPNDPAAVGIPLYFQAFVNQGGVKHLTNRVTLELQ